MKKKKKKKEKEKINLEKNNYLNENKIIENNNLKLENEIKELKNNLNLNIHAKIKEIKNNYLNENKIIENSDLKLEEIEKNIKNENLDNINYLIENIQNEINNTEIKLHKLEFDKQNIEPNLDNLMEIEEKIVNNNEKIINLLKLEKSINLAKGIIENSYEKMKNTVTPKFTENLSKNIDKITNGKYKNVSFQDEKGLIVELDNGNYVEANRLSVGTIDQLYFSLRLSMIDDLSNEKMPIILDEVFAYYDNERLENALSFLVQEAKQHQILIFTCTNKEKDLLEKMKVKYNLIEI